jgi:predicted acyltransferase
MAATPTPRNLVLDVFRGLTLALMIVVNTPGSDEASYAPLQHALWHGFTLTDLVFPSFLFVVGAAMSATMHKSATIGEAAFLAAVARRAGLIFLCGYLLYWFPFLRPDWTLAPIGDTRIPGVLQRIALCYLLAALILRYGKAAGAIVFSAAALLGYWWMLYRFGDYTLEGNAVRALDLAVFGARHLYHGEGLAFDPEGLLSTLPATVNVLAGYAAGRLMVGASDARRTIAVLLAAGAACLALSWGWDLLLPINKKLWTSSFVACTVGYDLVIAAALVLVIDVAGLRGWTGFFAIFGKNTLFIYLLADIAVIVLARLHVGPDTLYRWIYQHLYLSWARPADASLLFAVSYMLACWLVAWTLDRRRIYIKL